ncbi:MAG: murein hydrolase activator EnvC family protein [Beijerinckiaceae bacterium]
MVNRALMAGVVVAGVFSGAALAQQAPPRALPEAITPEQKLEREQELRRLEEALQRSQAQNAELAAEIARIRGDRVKLNTELVATSTRVREAEGRMQQAEQRLQGLVTTEAALRRSLDTRRSTIVEVLASLQRIGRKPPPAVLVSPEDMLQAIRTSMLLGTVLPELRHEAEILVQDLTTLVATREAMARERDQIAAETKRLQDERQRVTALIDARQVQLASSESRFTEERQKVQQLVRQSQTLKELITRMETEIASANRAAAAARSMPLPAQNPAQAAALAPGALRDMARLQPKIAFQDTKGTLSLPATGSLVKAFGSTDGFGGRENGLYVETGKFSLVTAPADGWVSFAGSYRSYGQVLIINAGGGYHLVMTGLDRVNVDIGQFVLAGEPVASMGNTSAGALASEAGNSNPVLYIEFRKDGVPIDPGPWWVKSDGEKVRG